MKLKGDLVKHILFTPNKTTKKMTPILSNQAQTMTMNKYLLILFTALSLQLFSINSLSAATTTWTGTTSSDWATATNWDTNTVPTGEDQVTIPDTATDPEIQNGTDAVALRIFVKTGGNLTLNTGSTLDIDGFTSSAIYNLGMISNSGIITVGGNEGVGGNGIENRATFTNESTGEIFIDNTAQHGISTVSLNSTFTNVGKITIGENGPIGWTGIDNRATFNNNTTGEIFIDNASRHGVFNAYNVIIFSNSGKITIGQNTAIGEEGISNQGIFANETNGEISINQTGKQGINNTTAIYSFFTNSGKIIIGEYAAIGIHGITNNGTFTNEINGEIFIDQTNRIGIFTTHIFTNSGKITIGENNPIGEDGINSSGTFTNEIDGEISIDRTTGNGLYISSSSGTTFTNSGKITIGENNPIGKHGLENGGTFVNEIDGEIFIDKTTEDGVFQDKNTFTNSGKITIGENATIGGNGINNETTFTNDVDGEISIDQTNFDGILNFSYPSSIFTNAGKITIGENNPIGGAGILNTVSFINEAGGEIYIDQTSRQAISSRSLPNLSNFTNAGKINIGKNEIIRGTGIRNEGILTNEINGEITIDQTRLNSHGIYNAPNSTWSNAGKIIIGENEIIGGTGIIIHGSFTNTIDGEIYIDQTTYSGINNSGGNVANSGKIAIGENGSIGWVGIENYENVTNKMGGEITIDQTFHSGISNNRGTFINESCAIIHCSGEITNRQTFQNEGFLFSNFEGSHNAFRNSIFTNTGAIQDLHGAFEGIIADNQDLLIAPLSSCTESNIFPDALQIGNDNSFTIGSDWYSDEELSTDAGDYDQNTNTFTLDIPLGNYTLYMEVTDNDNACSQVMAIQLKTSTPPTTNIEANEPCFGDDLNLTETGEGAVEWEWSGPNNFTSNEQNPTLYAPTTANSGDYTVIVTSENGCTASSTLAVEIPEEFSFDMDDATQTQTATGLNVYAVELCGGTFPFSIDLDAIGGFASSNLSPSPNAGCQNLQITYANGVEWTATITDANDCSNQSSTISSDDLGGTPLLMIDGFDVVKETGAGKLDGELTVNVSGGNDSCSDYTYDWLGPNTDTNNTDGATGNTLTGLAAGTYNVTITDCDGNTAVGSQYIGRSGGRSRGRSKTALDITPDSYLQLYPNPANDFVRINYKIEQPDEITIHIADLAGRVLWTQVVNQEEGQLNIPVNNLKNGLYIVTMRADNELIGKEKLLIVK